MATRVLQYLQHMRSSINDSWEGNILPKKLLVVLEVTDLTDQSDVKLCFIFCFLCFPASGQCGHYATAKICATYM